jgi:hypothetical protein
LNEEFIDLEQRADEQEQRKLEAARMVGREAAIEVGRLLGEAEAERRGEKGESRQGRVARAMAYAAWEYDGKPQGYGDRYQKEFATPTIVGLINGAQRLGPDPKNRKEK